GGEGADTALFGAGAGDDSFVGGDGAWTDSIHIENVTGGPGFGGWTVTLADGTPITDAADHGEIVFDTAVDGIVAMSDGSEMTFESIERLSW
ncbi:hypothetical protein, partial [Ferrovibrio sp.]|uniref:hypothetical protein n=1 Tax=Ferrovibrio sp. TaxID=1917215 RepID=UPI002609227A